MPPVEERCRRAVGLRWAGPLLLFGCPQLLEDDFGSLQGVGVEPAAGGEGGAVGGPGRSGVSAGGSTSADAGSGLGGGGPLPTYGDSGSSDPTWLDPAQKNCPFGTPQAITGLALPSGSEEWGPTLSADALTLVFASDLADNEDLFQATRSDRGASFSAAIPLSELNTEAGEGTPFSSADGLSLYFYSTRPGGPGGRDLYVATRPTLSAAFSRPTLLAGLNGNLAEHLPRLSADELTIIFSSTRAGGGGGGYDLWTATRSQRAETFGVPVPLTSVNTPTREESGNLSPDGLTLIYDSTRSGGLGESDIWATTRLTKAAAFTAPVLVTPLDGPSNELNVIVSQDELEVFFSSDRGSGGYHLWHAVRHCEPAAARVRRPSG